MIEARPAPTRPLRVMLLGATGTIGRATAAALVARGHQVVCLVRPKPGDDSRRGLPDAVDLRLGAAGDPASLARDGFPSMAIAACFAGPTFSLLSGMGGALAFFWLFVEYGKDLPLTITGPLF